MCGTERVQRSYCRTDGALEGKHRHDQDNSRCPGEDARSANGLGFRWYLDAFFGVVVAGSLGVG